MAIVREVYSVLVIESAEFTSRAAICSCGGESELNISAIPDSGFVQARFDSSRLSMLILPPASHPAKSLLIPDGRRFSSISTRGTKTTYALPFEWIESLKFMETLDINWVVGGHGPVGTKQAITDMRIFLQRCIDETRDAIKKGMTKEQEFMCSMCGANVSGGASRCPKCQTEFE